ncbi:MAG: hypothetical protein IKD84_02535 [Erysipelotrichaceae bacterium]|nr:hypothetical protein [Erysipelotrichaceae bacterium]
MNEVINKYIDKYMEYFTPYKKGAWCYEDAYIPQRITHYPATASTGTAVTSRKDRSDSASMTGSAAVMPSQAASFTVC